MTWQLAAFSILAFALAAGFAWYERDKPDARVVALVATLAAFAALGRIAFAALPNVKPTTDIVLISGYALGGAPGFAVGAIAGLTSNFFFGQGPWTPWQMAAWGATGIAGAALARVTAGRVGRIPLAVVCGVVGFAFTAVQDAGDWVTYSDHSTAQLGVYVGRGIGFDFVHAAGCVVFALALGPALIRSLRRFTMRLTVRWLPVGSGVGIPVVIVLATGALLAGQPGAGGAGFRPGAAQAAVTPAGYLLSAQNSDGGLGGTPGSASNPLYSGWAALGLAAEGYHLPDVRHGGASLLDYVQAAPASDPGSLERTMLVLGAAGVPAGSLLPRLQADIRSDGSVNEQVNLTSFAVLALRAVGDAPSARTLHWLTAQQDSDGGFNFATAGPGSDVDDTGATLEALAGTAPASVIGRAVRFVVHQQNSDGGFPSQPGGSSNAQSTAWAIQGLLAAGAGSTSVQRAESYLQSLVAGDGHVRYAAGSDQTPVWVTGEALMALARKPLPLAPPPAAPPAPAVTVTHHTQAHHMVNRHTVKHRLHARRSPGNRRAAPALGQFAADVAVACALVLAPIG